MKPKTLTLGFLAIVVLAILGPFIWDLWITKIHTPSSDEIWTSVSPDQRFRVDAYSTKGIRGWFPAMPGQGGYSDYPGWVVFRDNKTGKTLGSESLEMMGVALESDVVWYDDSVRICPGVWWDFQPIQPKP